MFAATITWDWSLVFEIAVGALIALLIAKHLP